MNNPKWTNKIIDISKLKPASYNPRKINRKLKPVFEQNLERFGILEPIVVNADYTIIGGHMRYNLYLEKGDTQVEVSVPDRLLNIEEEKELNIKLNSITATTNTNKLLHLGLSVEELQGLGYTELKLAEDKSNDKRNEVKAKNPMVYNLYYFKEDFFLVNKVIQMVQKNEKIINRSEAILFLIKY